MALARLQRFRARHPLAISASAFLAGFLFDLLTLGRIDNWWNISQQALWLFILGSILFLESQCRSTIGFRGGARLWENRGLISQFLFGSLLSAYAIFYVKSASFLSSVVFATVFGGLLVLNETSRVAQAALYFKSALYAFCVVSFLGYLVPILLGWVGPIPFAVSLILSFGFITLGFRKSKLFFREILVPSLAVMSSVSALYWAGWIPPVPVSVQYIGIYHGIEKEGGGYALLHERPWWKVWQNGDQSFEALPDDRIYCFARIFAPGRFEDEVSMHWLKHDEKRGWRTWDRIPIEIVGGREEGFRGYTFKQNYEPGLWQCRIETRDRREIGRMYFTVESVKGSRALAQDRNFKRDYQ